MKRYCIITIEREYASGGTQVGRLAGARPWASLSTAGRFWKSPPGKAAPPRSILSTWRRRTPTPCCTPWWPWPRPSLGQLPQISRTDQLNVLEGPHHPAAGPARAPACMVGRCAGWVLRERPHVLNVFIHAEPPRAPAPGPWRSTASPGTTRPPPCTGLTTGAPTSTM